MAEQTEKSFPFDAEEINGEHDRKYLAEDFTRYFRAFISSGTFMKESTNLQVMANGDMTVTLMPGSMIIEGTRYDNTQSLVFELTPADGVLNRIDRISIVYDKQQRDIHAEVLEGEPSYEPVPQSIRRTEEYKDYITADIYVAAGVVSIQQADITDQRLNSEVCGVAVPFTEIDTTTIFNQFLDWFEQIKSDGEKDVQQLLDDLKGLLDEDVAAHLQLEINKINEEMKNKISSSDVVDTLESTATDVPLSPNMGRVLNEKITTINNKLGGFKYTVGNASGITGLNTIPLAHFTGGCLYLLFIRVANSNNNDAKPCLLLLSVANDKSSANIVELSRDNSIISSYAWNTSGFQFNNASPYGCKYTVYLVG